MMAIGLAADLIDAPVARLSTGERQRLALVRALIQAPRFLLLDEPTSALDTATTLTVEALLQEARAQGIGLLVVTHDPAQADRLGGERYDVGRTGLSRHAA
jgi:ABC-type lipoprotein export system ATPase subunit